MKYSSVLALLAFAGTAVSAPLDEANPILQWNEAMVEALRSETNPPPVAVRNLAIFHQALLGAATEDSSQDEATARLLVNIAAHEAAVAMYPSRTASFDALMESSFPKPPLNVAQTALVARGRIIAARVLKERVDDGATAHVSYIPISDPGAWRRTPPFYRPPELPHWTRVKPFAFEKVDEFVPSAPPLLGSVEYAGALNEVKLLGSKTSETRSEEQTLIAKFWSDFSFTSTPPGHWNVIARAIASERKLSILESARLFEALNTAMSDVGVVMWIAKYRYNTWRPVTTIREADRDGNDQTIKDPSWDPLLATPPHPDYVSGHSGFSSAAAAVIEAFFRTDELAFVAESDAVPSVKRQFKRLSTAVNEISDSRIYGGIHFRFATEAGKACGKRIGMEVVARRFEQSKPKLNCGTVSPSFADRPVPSFHDSVSPHAFKNVYRLTPQRRRKDGRW